MKTINLELSKRLASYLENIKTTETIFIGGKRGEDFIKTLTTEEAIDFLPYRIGTRYLTIDKYCKGYGIKYIDVVYNKDGFHKEGGTLLEAIEKMITYLLDNNLIEKGKQ